MHWYDYLAWFFGGAFLANTIPHLVSGISGRAFHSPFAKPPGKGLSSSTVNVLWGFVNFVVAYLLVEHVGSFDFHNTAEVLTLAAGFLALSLMLASTFARYQSGR